jgi:hypothetical protein
VLSLVRVSLLIMSLHSCIYVAIAAKLESATVIVSVASLMPGVIALRTGSNQVYPRR